VSFAGLSSVELNAFSHTIVLVAAIDVEIVNVLANVAAAAAVASA
jgi:hypothetical protein